MGRSICSVKWQCQMAVREMMGHGGWEKCEWDVYVDGETGGIVPVICALKHGKISESSGDALQKILDEYFPMTTEGALDAFRESWEEHRRVEAQHKATWGDQARSL
jgi:hypothetical protein